jgi:catechol 2,3-dioxygenase-like lactoylglutathione lyase family enzyme
MSRVQLALNVSDLDAAVEFYTKLFATSPAKLRPGYANFAIAEPPLKLVLIEGAGQPGSLNHLGVEVATTDQVSATKDRLTEEGMATATEDQVTCCYALQDKVWVDDPDGSPWEIYTVLADTEVPDAELGDTVLADTQVPDGDVLRTGEPSAAACCAARPDLADQSTASTAS